MAIDVTEEEYDKTLSSSLKSVYFACQAAARIMIPQGGGKVVNIGSNFGEIAFKSRSVYAIAKAGLHHMSRALSLDWAKDKVNVNACITETETRKIILEKPGYKGNGLPRHKFPPEGGINRKIWWGVLFLSSPLSDMVVGHILVVDGGWTIH